MITQEDIDAMEDGMGLVERLRVKGLRSGDYGYHEAADRIEQIERELAAEKALADRLYEAARNYRVSAFWARDKSFIDAHAAYRKARGL